MTTTTTVSLKEGNAFFRDVTVRRFTTAVSSARDERSSRNVFSLICYDGDEPSSTATRLKIERRAFVELPFDVRSSV